MPRAGCVHSSACAATSAVLLFALLPSPTLPSFVPLDPGQVHLFPVIPPFLSRSISSFSELLYPLSCELLIEAVKKVQKGRYNDGCGLEKQDA